MQTSAQKSAKKILNLIFFQGLWFVAVIGASNDNNWYPLIGLVVFIACNHFLSDFARADNLLVGIAILTGLVVETAFLQIGLFSYNGGEPWTNIAPIWILVLWANFALTMNGCLRWLQGRYLLAAVLGTLGGPLSYFGGIKLGAAAAGTSMPVVLLVIAALYAVVTPTFLMIAGRLAAAEMRR
jgi:hypothetical protein